MVVASQSLGELMSYPPYDSALPALPERSRLYPLEPVGVGTPYVECLTGYVARLAEAHCVTAAVLFGWELVPLIAEKWLKRERANRAMILASRFRPLARAMNGAGVTAADWVRVLESATTRMELKCLTVLTWAGVLSQRHLLRPTRAWCPACYWEWRDRRRVVYEPLLWALAAVRVCPVHHLPLRTRCERCDRELFHLASHSQPGYCHSCRGWLGIPPRDWLPMQEALTDDELRKQVLAATAIGELLATAPRLAHRPEKEVIARSTAACINRASVNGTIQSFSSTHRLPKQTIANWWRGDRLPSLDSLLPLCSSTDVSVLDFLTGNVATEAAEDRPAAGGRRMAEPRAAVPRARRDIDRAADGRVLRAALRENPPRSMVRVALGMGRQPSALAYQFPELCSAIVTRFEQYRRRAKLDDWAVAERALEAALADESHPCVAEVARWIRWKWTRLRRRFPELCRLVTERHRAHRQVLWLTVEALLKAALEEEPPPPMADIVTRSGYCETSLYARFPTLCRRIGERHVAYRKVLFERKRDDFAEEVRGVALAVLAEGVYPSVKRVEARLPRSVSLRSSKLGLEVLRRVREELGLDSRAEAATRF